MRFTKIKASADKVHLEWNTPAENRPDNEVHHKLESDDTPTPEFTEALQAFVPEVLNLLELDRDYGVGLTVIGLSINYEDSGRLGLVITCLKQLEATNAPLVLNTPHLRAADDDDEGAGGNFLPDGILRLLQNAEEQAEQFVHGARMQLDLLAEASSIGSVTFSSPGTEPVTITR